MANKVKEWEVVQKVTAAAKGRVTDAKCTRAGDWALHFVCKKDGALTAVLAEHPWAAMIQTAAATVPMDWTTDEAVEAVMRELKL